LILFSNFLSFTNNLMNNSLSNVSNTRAVVPRKRRRVRANAGRVGGQRRANVAAVVEPKTFDVVATLSVNTWGNYFINGMARDVLQNARVGNDIVVRTIQWKGTVAIPPQLTAAAATMAATGGVNRNAYFNFMIVQDLQTNGAVFDYTDLFRDLPAGVRDAGFALRSRTNTSRFKILSRQQVHVKDCVKYIIDGTSGTTAVFNSISGGVQGLTATAAKFYAYSCGAVVPFQGFLNVNIPIKFSGSTGAITELKSNCIFAMWTMSADADGVAGRAFVVDVLTRITFRDIIHNV
jgi:hypothetical protein